MDQNGNNRIDAVLADAVNRLDAASESPRLDAEVLLARTIDMPRSYLFAHPEDELDDVTLERFESLLSRRTGGEPMAYIMGTREFWSRELVVSPATLVPRPETELLVELALREIPRKADWRILDLGTGSGAIAIAIAGERLLCDVVATDISSEALAIAAVNARHLSLGNLSFAQGDWTQAVADQDFDIIVSNPPYVRADDKALLKLQHEPHSALVAGADGLQAFRTLAGDCGGILKPGGTLLLEHGADQQQALAAILEAAGWTITACHKDFSGLPRVTVARRDGK
jgi:release factor glutamine methyltransferase